MKPILKDKEEFPSVENLANHLSEENLMLYQKLLEEIHQLSFKEDWNYYNDGKNWLAKILFKKKNLGWISIWQTGIKITVFFGERIWPKLVESELFSKVESTGASIQKNAKLTAVLIPIQNEANLQTALELIRFKKAVK